MGSQWHALVQMTIRMVSNRPRPRDFITRSVYDDAPNTDAAPFSAAAAAATVCNDFIIRPIVQGLMLLLLFFSSKSSSS